MYTLLFHTVASKLNTNSTYMCNPYTYGNLNTIRISKIIDNVCGTTSIPTGEVCNGVPLLHNINYTVLWYCVIKSIWNRLKYSNWIINSNCTNTVPEILIINCTVFYCTVLIRIKYRYKTVLVHYSTNSIESNISSIY